MEQYIREYGGRLFGLALKLCKNREDAEDLYQETWIKAYRFLDRYNGEKEFGAWITTICVNSYKDMLRRQKWIQLFPLFRTNEEKDLALSNAAATATGAATGTAAQTVMEDQESITDVRNAVNALPEKYRLAVILHYFNDLDIKKTAETLGIPEGTVKYNLHKARALLERSLHTDG